MSIAAVSVTCALAAAPGDPSARPEASSSAAGTSLAVFDDPQEWAQFSQPVPGQAGLWISELRVQGMHCAACALTVEQALCAVAGVQSAQVSSASGRARITWSDRQTRPSRWLPAADPWGYRLWPELDPSMQAESHRQARLMLWRWLVAGFCMMQVMMYAYPAYIAGPGTITPDIEQLLRWASWMLSLPVLLFSARPFFANALRDLSRRRISMDLPVSLGMAITFLISTAATFEPSGWWGGEVYFDSLTMFVFFLLTGRWLEQRLRERTAGSLDALMQRLPHSAERRLPDGSFETVALRRLQPGEVIRVRPGEAFAGDGVLLEGQTHVDESLLTGESRPLVRSVGAQVLAGSHNLTATVLMRLSRLGTSTRYAEIVSLMQQAAVDKPKLAQLADRVARPFLWAVLLVAAAAAVHAWPTDPARGLMAAVAVLIVTCPCALSLATPSAMLTSAGWLARQGVLVRRLQALETLQTVDCVIFDKTGTLTESRMGLRSTELTAQARARGLDETQVLQLAQALAVHSLHPVSRALADESASLGRAAPLITAWVEERAGQGVEGELAEAAGWPVQGRLRWGRADFCQGQAVETDALQVFLADETGCLARFELDEVLRSDAAALVARFQAEGLKVQLLSGDRDAAVQRLAARLGIAGAWGDCSPEAKLQHLQALQRAGHRVLMVGDGLNDGPVLAQADVSVAVGASVPLAQAQADLVMPSGQIGQLAPLLVQSRRTVSVVRQNLAWAAAYNAVCVPLALTGSLPAWLAGLGMALSSLLVVANAARLARSPALATTAA